MNFITNLSSNKRSNDVYDFVLVIINCYIKMTFYIFVTKKITIVELTEIIFDHVMLKYNVSKDVVSNKKFVFTSAYWTNICYHMKMKRRLSIVFHFANRRSNKTSKSEFKALFTSVLLRKANRMNKILVFDWIRLSKQRIIHHWMQSLFLHVRL
jgi:hypothetical protein